jgi:Na+-driven multidrug efflux pump
MNIAVSETAEATADIELSPQMRRLLNDPIVPTLLRMAWPNILIMLAQASTGLIETFWIARLGTDALAGMALVFPEVMMVQMIANGAMGGGISSAIARAVATATHTIDRYEFRGRTSLREVALARSMVPV